jgi:hypothetical protein
MVLATVGAGMSDLVGGLVIVAAMSVFVLATFWDAIPWPWKRRNHDH